MEWLHWRSECPSVVGRCAIAAPFPLPPPPPPFGHGLVHSAVGISDTRGPESGVQGV